jgi:hypothetical protein
MLEAALGGCGKFAKADLRSIFDQARAVLARVVHHRCCPGPALGEGFSTSACRVARHRLRASTQRDGFLGEV